MDVIVIGGGASGMIAAITAARMGANVTIIEKEDRLGRKILATGNGKCNWTNTDYPGQEYNVESRDFVKQVFEQVSPEEIMNFFQALGIHPRVGAEGRVYPASEQASSVLDALRMEVEREKTVEVVYEHWVKGIVPKRGGDYAVVTHRNLRMSANRIIIACGGNAGPQYGCEGDGYALAEMLGHKVKEPCPALVQLTSEETYFSQLKGVRAKGSVTLVEEGAKGQDKRLGSETGEIQFTETGLSGICVFNLSGMANRRRQDGKRCAMLLDLFPEIEKADFLRMMQQRLAQSEQKTAEEFLNGLIHKKLIPVILRVAGVEKTTLPAKQITDEQLAHIAYWLKSWRVPIRGSRSWNDAQTTSGGVVLSEVEAKSMESRLHQGLFFAGEVLDVDGKCGGYNLQWAWSSGMLAGRSAAK